MTLPLCLCILAPLADAFVQFWGPMSGMYPPMQPLANQMPMHMPMHMQMPNMMYFPPRQSIYQPSFLSPRPMLQPQSIMPQSLLPQSVMPQSLMPQSLTSQSLIPPVTTNLSPVMNVPTTTPNSFLSIFDALATILQREAQKNQYIRMQELASSRNSWERPHYPGNVQISDPNDGQFEELPLRNTEGLSNLINSLPAPEIVSLMNYQLANKRMNKHKSGPPIMESFKIEKGVDEELPPSTPIEKESSAKTDEDSLMGLLRSGRWKTIDWRRKILGLDEIPTAEEGNALAQLFQDKDKDRKH